MEGAGTPVQEQKVLEQCKLDTLAMKNFAASHEEQRANITSYEQQAQLML